MKLADGTERVRGVGGGFGANLLRRAAAGTKTRPAGHEPDTEQGGFFKRLSGTRKTLDLPRDRQKRVP